MQVEWPSAQEPDDRLRLIFTCCHPALSREAQIALTLRAVCGLTSDQIARAFLTSEATIAKRIVRARRKIVDAGIPYRLPRSSDLEERIGEVLAVLYLTFNEGYLATAGPTAQRRDLAEDAARLTAMLSKLLPDHAEILGLLALMQLHLARTAARFDLNGDLVLLQNQDRARWDREGIDAGIATLQEAAKLNHPGIYQLQAAIVACHADAPSWELTDWRQIVALYDALYEIAPTPVVQLNRAIAVAHLAGAADGLRELAACADRLEAYPLYHSARALLMAEMGDRAEERSELQRALELTTNPAERSLLLGRRSSSRDHGDVGASRPGRRFRRSIPTGSGCEQFGSHSRWSFLERREVYLIGSELAARVEAELDCFDGVHESLSLAGEG
jgi:RNA polymerase sigma-70 factor (ECF subfamily)